MNLTVNMLELIWARALQVAPRVLLVLVVLIVHVHMLVIRGVVDVLDVLLIARRPKPPRTQRCHESQRAQHSERRLKPERHTHPPGQRVGHQPAQMRQCELGGEEYRAVACVRRPDQQPAGRRLHERAGHPKE